MSNLYFVSPLEKRIYEAIPEDGEKITTLELVREVYKNHDEPLHARHSVINAVKVLMRKIEVTEWPVEIHKSEAFGAKPLMFWKTAKKEKSNGS